MQSGTSNITFSYRIMSKRNGIADLRFPTQAQVIQANQDYLTAKFPEKITERNNQFDDLQETWNGVNVSHQVQAPAVESIPAVQDKLPQEISTPTTGESLQQINPDIQDESTLSTPPEE